MSPRLIRVVLCLVAMALFLSVSVPRLNAQVLYGSLVGTVTDQTGAVVPKATVTITNNQTGLTRETTTDEGGRYSIVSIPPGTYSLKVTASGFKTFSQTSAEVIINVVGRVDVKLEVGALAETISVTGEAALLSTDKADVHTELGTTAVTNLPLLAYRNYQSLLVTVPGATPVLYQNDITDTPSRSLRTNVNGMNPNTNTTRVDGATNIYLWLPHHTLLNPPVESIETVNIATNSLDAEQGMAGGAAITVTTKSGTNDIHGTAFWYHDNQHLYARPYFWYRDKPLSIRNMPGGTIGGAVKKNKLFYFFSFERTMEHVGVSDNYSVPPDEMRRGDFSKWAGLTTIYDPLTGDKDGSNRRPFPNNIVPRERFNPVFDNLQKLIEAPNQAAVLDPAWGLSGNYGVSGMRTLDRNQYDLKVNWTASAKLLIWGKYSHMDGDVGGKFPFKELTGSGLGTQGNGLTHVKMPSFGFNYTFSPTLLMDGVFGYSRFDQQVVGPNYGKNYSEIWKIPGTNGQGKFAKDPRYGDQPSIGGFGFSAWGYQPTWSPVTRNDRIFTYTTNFSKVKRGHEIRWGFDMNRFALNHWQPETTNPRGYIEFTASATMLRGGTARTPNSYAAALLGLVGTYQHSVQFFDMKAREWQLSWYVRDRWQATRNLTVSLGLRYEYYPLINRGDRGIERWDPATNIVYFGGLGNTPRDAGVTVSHKLFAPRLGIAYRLGTKTVVRTGYGLSPDPLPFARPLRGLYPATITANWTSEQYDYFNTIDKGIPDVPLPDVSKGQLVLPKDVDMGPRSPWGGLLHRGYIQSWNFTIERQLPVQLTGSIGYVGTHMVHQLIDRDINAALVPGSGNAGRPLYATQGRTIGMSMWDGWADANYNGLQATLNRSYKGLYLKTSYTWSKSIAYADENGWVGLPLTNHPAMLRRNRAPAGYDRRHMFVQAWVYDLPVGKGQKFNISNPILDNLFGGWKINGLLSMYTGMPFTVTASTVSLNMPGTGTQTADIVGTPKKLGQIGPGTTFYDVSTFRDPNWGRPSNVYRLGTGGRNTLYGPGFIRPDISFFKNFKLTERLKTEFRFEGYNFTNTPRFSNPGASVSAMVRDAAGAITNTSNFMAVTSTIGSTAAISERQFRLGLKLTF